MSTTVKEFESVFPSLVDDLAKHAKATDIPDNAYEMFIKVIISDWARGLLEAFD
jgi:hypothetical protein